MQLILPNREYEQSYREYILELGEEERYPFPLDFDHSDFEEMRGLGLGVRLLGLTLEKAYEHDIAQIHVHCHKHNVPSARMIIANGGLLDSEIDDGGEIIQRYVIEAP